MEDLFKMTNSNIQFSKSSTALVVVDMQNAFIAKEGSISKLGIDTSRTKYSIPTVSRLIDVCHGENMPVIYTKMSLRKDYMDAGILNEVFPPLRELGHAVKDSWDGQIIDELKPQSSDYIIEKTRFSGFYNTSLESLLRCLKIDTLIMVGVATNVCVEATVRDAFYRDFRVIVPKDATSSYSEEMENASFINFDFGFAKLSHTEEIIKSLTH